jgi:putative inorganic carbon (HCO3(-)) transporter
LREAAREFRTVVLEAGVFYGLRRVMVRKRRDVWRVVDAWVLGGALMAAMGIFQWAFGRNLITADGVSRVRGFYGSPNNLALYLGRVFPLCLAIAVFRPAGILVSGRVERRRRWAYGLAVTVMAAAILLTYSRGAWLLGVPAALLFLAAMRGRRTLAFAVGGLLLVALVVLVVVGPGRLTSLLDTSEGTTFFRLQLWQSSWAMVRDHPLLGVGLDNFLYFYRSHYVLPTAWEEFNLSHPHNLVLDFWLRLGLMGVVVMAWLLVAFFQRTWRAYRRLPDGSDRLLHLGLMAGMVNFVVHGLVDNAFFLVDLAFVFVLMLALAQLLTYQSTNLPTMEEPVCAS